MNFCFTVTIKTDTITYVTVAKTNLVLLVIIKINSYAALLGKKQKIVTLVFGNTLILL